MSVCECVYVQCVYVHVCVCVRKYVYLCMNVCMCMLCINKRACTYVCIYTCVKIKSLMYVGYSLAMVEIVKGYSMNDWREDLKRILMQAGVKDKQTTFLFSDVQVRYIFDFVI